MHTSQWHCFHHTNCSNYSFRAGFYEELSCEDLSGQADCDVAEFNQG